MSNLKLTIGQWDLYFMDSHLLEVLVRVDTLSDLILNVGIFHVPVSLANISDTTSLSCLINWSK